MKRIIYFVITLFVGALCLTSCKTSRASANGRGTTLNPKVRATSFNEYDLIISDSYITYTIDISTAEGKLSLNKKKLPEAQMMVENEAAMANHCDLIWQPKYSYLMDGKKILRITISGRPANYKNTQPDYEYVPMNNRQRIEVVTKHQ